MLNEFQNAEKELLDHSKAVRRISLKPSKAQKGHVSRPFCAHKPFPQLIESFRRKRNRRARIRIKQGWIVGARFSTELSAETQKEFLDERLNAWSQFDKPPSSEPLCFSQPSHCHSVAL
jgi:hypothetical protein